ncbi:MAG: chemotaxis protein CheW [Anaerolinea sp.]|nr:chemotaxis protein CheW [Anaerolinea sp.]
MATDTHSESRSDAREEHVVIFRLASEFYALDIQHIQEIVRMQQITAIPGAAYYVDGLTKFRGNAIPVIDLRRRCGVAASEYTQDTRIVVVSGGDGMVGLTVDAVTEVKRIPGEQIEPNSNVVREAENDYIRGIAKLEDRLVALLELGGLIPAVISRETETLEPVQAAA